MSKQPVIIVYGDTFDANGAAVDSETPVVLPEDKFALLYDDEMADTIREDLIAFLSAMIELVETDQTSGEQFSFEAGKPDLRYRVHLSMASKSMPPIGAYMKREEQRALAERMMLWWTARATELAKEPAE